MRKFFIAVFLGIGFSLAQSVHADTLIASGSVNSTNGTINSGWVELSGNDRSAGAEISNGQYAIYRPSDQTWPNGQYTLKAIPDTEVYPLNQATSTTINYSGNGTITQNISVSAALKQINVTVLDSSGNPADVTVHVNASGGGHGMSYTSGTNDQGQATFTVRPEGAPYRVTVDNCSVVDMAGTQSCVAWIYTGEPVTISFAQADNIAEIQTVSITGETPSATVTGHISYEGTTFEGFVHLYSADHLFSGWMNTAGDFTVYALPGSYKIDLLPKQSQSNPDVVRYYIDDAMINGAITVGAGETDIGDLAASYESSTIHATVKDDAGNLLEGVVANFWLAGGGEWRQITLMPGAQGDVESEAHSGVYYVNAIDPTGNSYLPAPAQQVVVTDNSEPTVELTMVRTNATTAFTITTPAEARAATFNSFMDCWDETNQRGNGVEIVRGAGTIHLAAGTYTCTAVTPQNAEVSLPPITLTVAAGDAVAETTALVEHDAVLSGQILDQHDSVLTPTADSEHPLTVVLEGEVYGHFEVPVNDDGTWSETLPPDNYTVKVTGDEVLPLIGEDTLTTVTLASGDTKVDENLTALTPDSQITATVLGPDQETPVAFTPVTCTYLPEGQKGDFAGGRVISVTGETDANGVVELDVLKKDGKEKLDYDCGVSVDQASGYVAPMLEAVQPGKVVDFTVAEPDVDLQVNYKTNVALTDVQCQAWSDDSTTMLTAADEDEDGDVAFDISKEAGKAWNVSCAGVNDDTWYTVKTPKPVLLAKADSYETTVTLKENDVTVPTGTSQSFDGTGEKSLTVDGVGLVIPANAIQSDGEVTLTVTPTATDLPKNEGNSTFGVPLNFQAFDSSGNVKNKFSEDIVVSMPYDEVEVKAAGIVETDLEPKYFDETGGAWQPIPGYQINTETNVITFSTDHFTQFGLLYNNNSAGSAPHKVKKVTVPVKKMTAAKVKVIWTKVKSAASYDLQLLNKKGKVVKTFSAITTPNYTIVQKWVEANMTYRVRVRSVGANSLYSKWSKLKTFHTSAAE